MPVHWRLGRYQLLCSKDIVGALQHSTSSASITDASSTTSTLHDRPLQFGARSRCGMHDILKKEPDDTLDRQKDAASWKVRRQAPFKFHDSSRAAWRLF